MPSDTIQPRVRHSPGFTLVELAIVVAIISILAALAIPYYKHIKEKTQISALKNDLRLYEQELDTYELQNQSYPPSQSTPGVFPVGMDGHMSLAWKLPSPIGGEYRWVNNTTGANPKKQSAYIQVHNSTTFPITIDTNRLIEIDEDLDDGNISTGRLRLSGLDIRYYVKL